MTTHIRYDENQQSFVFDSRFQFEKFKPLLIEHFENGGGKSLRILGGLLGVNHQTVANWLNPKSDFYKKIFAELISELKCKTALATDQQHRDVAFGKATGDSRTLNRRYDALCFGVTDKLNKDASYNEKITYYTEQFLKGDLPLDNFVALTKGLGNFETTKLLEIVQKDIDKKNGKLADHKS